MMAHILNFLNNSLQNSRKEDKISITYHIKTQQNISRIWKVPTTQKRQRNILKSLFIEREVCTVQVKLILKNKVYCLKNETEINKISLNIYTYFLPEFWHQWQFKQENVPFTSNFPNKLGRLLRFSSRFGVPINAPLKNRTAIPIPSLNYEDSCRPNIKTTLYIYFLYLSLRKSIDKFLN